MSASQGILHHVELWVDDLAASRTSLGWLLRQLGYEAFQHWSNGCSWRLGDTYIVLEQSPALTEGGHDRTRAGLNHLAFHVRDSAEVERLATEATEHGWTLLFGDRHPYAGGRAHYAAYLEDTEGFEVELVAAAE